MQRIWNSSAATTITVWIISEKFVEAFHKSANCDFFALLITLIQQEQNFWLEFFSYTINIVLQYDIWSLSVSFQ